MVFDEKEGLSADQFIQIMNHESGLLGVSGSSGDMQDLLLRDATDFKAVEAINLFCYYIKKAIGAFTAALGGVDTLVFTGGIGENAPVIRERICTGLDFLGLKLNAEANTNQNKNISANDSRVNVYIIPTDEELMMAQIVNEIIHI